MKISQKALPWIQTAILLAFVAASIAFYALFFVGAGGTIPLITSTPYSVVFQSPINKNLVNQSQVTVNGVAAGRVLSVDVVDGVARIRAGLGDKPELAPLHQGVRATIKTKTLINETYVDITDGDGPALPDGALVPMGTVTPPVDTDEVIRALPQSDRQALGGTLQSLDEVTAGNQSGISQTFGSLGEPTRYVPAALTALSRQEIALRQLSANTAKVLDALDTRQGQIADLVNDADTVTKVTAGSSDDLKAVIEKLAPTLSTAQDASGDLSRLGGALQPFADNLNQASGPLNDALAQLPGTSKDLRGLLPALDTTLQKLPPTLQRVPDFAGHVQDVVPPGLQFFGELNPILAYLKPCGPNVAPFFTNFADAIVRSTQAPNGPVGGVAPTFGYDSIALPPGVPKPMLGAGQFSYDVGNPPGGSNAGCNTPLQPYTR
ncbi:MlaD family protein [Actinomycetospora sp. TBRC 11914]|uniref:MlaD family protein n=1 Tax=Actinomycetospora sp. TBRC 11914 TaxID=2729387 RepID=UPI00145C70B6|nr:MlaD family protein [Actinomycetospora sp. TBRC 11914]NMO92273.1 MCE family protein [Actinomycetospora sp. TBRC 11914]